MKDWGNNAFVPSKFGSTLGAELEWKPEVALRPALRPAWRTCCMVCG